MTTLLTTIFVVGYLLIAIEHKTRVNKAAIALLTGAMAWTVLIISSNDKHLINEQLQHHLGELSGILFFLLGAMAVVELIDAHDGFDIITSRITTTSKLKLLWIIALLAFFLSAVLDNLTTTIVLVSLIRKLAGKENTRLLYCGVVVIAANAGGAWSPIGDVTTTMLWIGGQITSHNIITALFLPSLVCALTPLALLSISLRGQVQRPPADLRVQPSTLTTRQQATIFFAGIGVLLFVPVFKTITHLPPYMGMLAGLGFLWVLTEILHGTKDQEDKHTLSVVYALRKIDTPSILFFFGILVSIAALQTAGILSHVATLLDNALRDERLVCAALGLLSAAVDNVPLVAAAQAMYPLSQYPQDHAFWEFLAYCTGTGGSTLIIGSAAGVAAMGLENISFGWYLRKMSWLALAGFLAGAGAYLLQSGSF